jgi:hypothetical protein
MKGQAATYFFKVLQTECKKRLTRIMAGWHISFPHFSQTANKFGNTVVSLPKQLTAEGEIERFPPMLAD